MGIIIGIKYNGERIRFERWVYRRWRERTLADPYLIACLNSCIDFRENYGFYS